MNEVTMIGVDLAKSVSQAHGATAAGENVFWKEVVSWVVIKVLE